MKRKQKSVLRGVLSHLVLVSAAMLLTLFILDRFNEAMAFLNNDLTKWILAFFAVAAGVLAVTVIVQDERERKKSRSAPEDGSEGEIHERQE